MFKKSKGFTLVELIIVIVIIGILAAVSVVGYTNQTSKARDTIRKSDLTQIYKALQVRNVNIASYVIPNSGWNGGGQGFFNQDYDVAGPYLSIAIALVDDGTLPREMKDPINTGLYRYMFRASTTLTSIYAKLENVVDNNSDDWDDASDSGVNTTYGPTSTYKMTFRVGNGF
jgi:prepilin-type N-terminal cleavage/methylation domain-containing protein